LSEAGRFAGRSGKDGLLGGKIALMSIIFFGFTRIRVLIRDTFLSVKQAVAMDSGIIRSLLHLESQQTDEAELTVSNPFKSAMAR
jgi:hypothetical protein